LTIVNTTVLAPMQSAKVATTIVVNAGRRASVRAAGARSWPSMRILRVDDP
jgi:hypothetical protein